MKTRTISYQDGRREIFRLLSEEQLASGSVQDPLAYEASILWLEDISRLPYVRVRMVHNCTSRRGKLLPRGGGRVVGYAKLVEDAPADPARGGFTRRVFYLRHGDESKAGEQSKPVPAGAVDPRTVAPGVAGRPPGKAAARRATAAVARGAAAPDDRLEEEVAEWLAEVSDPAPTVLQREPAAKPRNDRSQAMIDTELAHDEPDESRPRHATVDELQRGAFGILLPLAGGQPIPLTRPKLHVGRMAECDIVLPFSNVSGLHCQLIFEKGFWFVQDLWSTNGIKVNGQRVPPDQKVPLNPGSILSIAKHQFEVRYNRYSV